MNVLENEEPSTKQKKNEVKTICHSRIHGTMNLQVQVGVQVVVT